jgi:hypothetical protein
MVPWVMLCREASSALRNLGQAPGKVSAVSCRAVRGTGAPRAGSFNPDRPGSAPASGQRSPLAAQD